MHLQHKNALALMVVQLFSLSTSALNLALCPLEVGAIYLNYACYLPDVNDLYVQFNASCHIYKFVTVHKFQRFPVDDYKYL